MKASYENVLGIIRAGPQHDGFGTPFTFSVAVLSLEPEVAFLKAAVGSVGREEMRAIAKILLMNGFKRAKWERQRGKGQIKIVELDLEKVAK